MTFFPRLTFFAAIVTLFTSCKTHPVASHTSQADDYGLSANNPVQLGSKDELGGPEAERVFLWHIEDAAGKRYHWTREGSVGPGPDGHMIDVFSSPEAGLKKIYIDMYHPKIHPFHATAPRGFKLWF